MTKRKKIIIGLGTVAILAGIVNWLYPAAGSITKQDAKTVAAVAVTRESLSRTIVLSAEFRPFQEADLRAMVSGYVQQINVDIGDQVKEGEVIATLETDELKADRNRAAAAYRDAKLNYDRISIISKKRPGLLAQEEVDKAQVAYEMAKATMLRAETLLEYATILMPFDGVVTKRFTDKGALIQAGTSSASLPIVHVADNTKLRLFFPVPESAVSEIRVGTPVELTVQATGQTLQGNVTRIAGKVDSATRTMETEVDIDNSDRRIIPGMYASVKIELEKKEAALCLPIQAIIQGDKPHVWRINDAHEIEDAPVTVGLQTADKVEILSGLQAGDQVIFGSRGSLGIGMKVNPKPVADKKG